MNAHEAHSIAESIAQAYGRKTTPGYLTSFAAGLSRFDISEAIDALERIYARPDRPDDYLPPVNDVVREIRQLRMEQAQREVREEYSRQPQERPLSVTQRRDIINRKFERRLHELETPYEPEVRPVHPVRGETSIHYTKNVGGIERDYVRASPSFCAAYEAQTRNMKAEAEARRRSDPKVLQRVEDMRRDLLKVFAKE